MMPSIKRISAVLLAVSFFLPLAQCSQKVGEKSAPVTVTASNTYEGLTLWCFSGRWRFSSGAP
jgi:hypothetical protein